VRMINIPRFTAEASLYRTSGRYLAAGHASESSRTTRSVHPAMINDGGVNCGNCVGGDCVELRCFENWTHGGGGVGGPYEGGGGSGAGTGARKGCRDASGRVRRHGTTIVTTVEGPGGGIEDTYVVRQRCNNGNWSDVPY
jgi:hypothetical protein